MKNISDIDVNFKVETNIKKDNIKFYDVLSKPFGIYGLIYENGKFRRLPEKVAASVSEGVYELHANTAGGRVRFRTDSSYVAIKACMEKPGKMPHFALVGSAGFDLYADNEYSGTFEPPFDIKDGFESVVELGTGKMRDILIDFPLYSDVCKLYIGLEDGAVVEEPTPYRDAAPIVYYGSSITQGGCASRPGTCYQAYISRQFDIDHINLGFSGNAKAEPEISEYIRNLDMSVFVYDYDHNAPTVEHLNNTHERMFKEIREAHPDLPVIMMSRPKFYLDDAEKERRKIIEKTYENAISSGDSNVYFISGDELTELCGNEGTVDNCHPTDYGFAAMAAALSKVIEKIEL